MTFLTEIQREFPGLVIKNEELSQHTSFQIGGLAHIAFPKTVEELIGLWRFCVKRSFPARVLGTGTNILAPDAGLQDLVICTKELKAIREIAPNVLEAECGVLMSRFASFARDLGLTGLEFAHGIPGTVGGGVYMNAGAYGGEMCQVVVQTQAMLPDGTLVTVCDEAHEFSYRHSVFEDKHAVILRTQVRLQPGDRDQITARMQELIQKRRTSQPLEMPSAGSTFKRPAGGYAAAMIDEAGLKGCGVGGAAVSQKHAGFVVNLGGASAADVLATMRMIEEKVFNTTGILLEPEVRIW